MNLNPLEWMSLRRGQRGYRLKIGSIVDYGLNSSPYESCEKPVLLSPIANLSCIFQGRSKCAVLFLL